MVLTGTEIKSIRNGKVNIKDSYAIIRQNEIYLLNTHISLYDEGNRFNHEEERTRKLLLHKKEILKLKMGISLEKKTITGKEIAQASSSSLKDIEMADEEDKALKEAVEKTKEGGVLISE